jgi:hypothetical protein
MDPNQLQQGAQQGANAAGQGMRGGPPSGLAGMGGRRGFLPGGPVTSIVVVALFVITLVVLAIAFYKLFQKAGMNGALGLLMLVPVVNLGVALWFAFAEWPVLVELAHVKMIAATAVPGGVAAPTPEAAPPIDPVEPAVPLTT